MKHGIAFPDYINTEDVFNKHAWREREPHVIRISFLIFLLIAVPLVIAMRLFAIQVIQGSFYRSLSDENRTQTVLIHAPRGVIFDRNGTPLVFNTPGFRKIEKDKIILLPKDQALSLIARGEKLSIDSLRSYPYKDVFAHVVGYIGQVSKKELASDTFSSYLLTDVVGKTGIERFYEQRLKGLDGKQLVEVDAWGKTLRVLGKTDPVAGENITLTLDVGLQSATFDAINKVKKGVVMVSTPQGEILALVSRPSYDPNLFTLDALYAREAIASESAYGSVSDILSDSYNQPLLNRAISGEYPPGSTFKIITAAAGLEKDVDEHFVVEDTGILNVGAFSFANWYFTKYGKTEGMVNMVKGLARSNDIFFYKLAERLGVDALSDMAKQFGLGEKTGIDLLGERRGIVPSDSWKKETIGEQWYLGDTYHYGIGQGYLLVTPLQVNGWTQAIANGGSLYQPRLINDAKLRVKNEKFLKDKTVELIREGMIKSCSPGGVAWPLFKFKVQNEKLKIDGKNFLEPSEATVSAQFKTYREIVIACKTGTAQHGGERDLPHAWITLFAPAYNPQIVVTVLAESSGEGSDIAAPIAKKILEEWFSR